MLAVLSIVRCNSSGLSGSPRSTDTSPTSARAASPRDAASTAAVRLGVPASLAKWLRVPPGRTRRGRECSTAAAAAVPTVPSPPQTPRATTPGRLATRAIPSARSSSWATSFIYALGNTFWSAAAVSSAYEPPSVFTAMPSPSPSGSSAAFTAVRRCSGIGGRTGHHFRVTRAAPAPIADPKKTSEGQWAPVWTREYATPAARGASAAPRAGRTRPAPSTNATAEAECPDGMEELVGWGWTKRKTGRCSGSGRARGSSVLNPRFVTAEATACASTPCRAARRVLPGKRAITAAMPNQSLPLFAEAESRRKKSS